MPARRRPCNDTPAVEALRKRASSEEAPLRWVRSTNAVASWTATSRLTAVPSQAAIAFGPMP
jgi:hypothetical protein